MKRSNSAPMIPEMLQAVELKPPTLNSLISRRGLSTSNVSLPGDIILRPELSPRRQPLPLSRINSPTSRQHRVEQLKKEELLDERHNEREVQEQILLTKTCSDLKLNPEDNELKPESMDVQVSPTHQSFAPPASPLTRPLSHQVRSRSLTPTSPSSARQFSYRRSCSPVLRPSSLCFGQKRKRDQDNDDMMDISPSSLPSKKLHLGGGGCGGYASPHNISPCVSPHMSFQHSFLPAMITASRKSSSTQSESTPLSSPSSLIQSNNPFAVNYDSGNCEHWQSGHSGSASGSTCSSAGQSPPGITVNEEHKMMMDPGPIDISTEAPTPLSPKGLQFRQKPFNLHTNNLPSPIPRTLTNGMCAVNPHVHVINAGGGSAMGGANSHVGTVPAGIPLRGGASRGVLKPHPLHHDKHLSPFNSDLAHPHPHSHAHSHIHPQPSRPIKVATRSRLSKEIKSDPLRPSSTNSSSSVEHHSGNRLNSRPNSCSSPLAKLSITSSLEDNATSILHAGHHGSPAGIIVSRQLRERQLTKRRNSETSTDSREESYMDSDNDGPSLEEPVDVHLCDSSQKPAFDTEMLHTHS